MDHHCHRKRKTDGDDTSKTEDHGTDAPRQPWQTPSSPQVSSPLAATRAKRPRIDTSNIRAQTPDDRAATIYSPIRTPSDIEDIGIAVTASDPGPSSGSLLRVPPPHIRQPTPSRFQPDYASHHIPPMTPLINRQTLKELDLDVIIRNPVLRHDLLFDAGLQFRPRRKRDLSEKYWNAVWEEVRSGCTCITLDTYGKLLKTVCVCSRSPEPPVTPMAVPISRTEYTIRMPSRIPALLAEFLEVMVFVIQPLTNTNVYSNPNDVKEQAREHSAHAAHLREIFDPTLIYQELKHNVFSPSGLFQHIGETLKHHCAPMRDRAVEDLVQFAQLPGIEAFKAFRTCLELLELMKLDIANHQLTQLRPWLLRHTGTFEIKAFKMRFGSEPSLHHTREWLHSTHNALIERDEHITHPSYPEEIAYQSMTRNQQIYVSALRGIVDIVYDHWIYSNTSGSQPLTPVASPSTPTTTTTTMTPASPTFPSAVSKPETLYLDKTRLVNLSTDATDTTALYMFMLLFRQLAFAELGEGSSSSSRPVKRVDELDEIKLRQELVDIGPAKMGACFIPLGDGTNEKEKKDLEQRRNRRLDLVLQVAKRASDLRRSRVPLSSKGPSSSPTDPPDQRLLNIATRWVDTNMQPGSLLSVLLHNRMREVLFDLVVSLAFPGKDAAASLSAAANGTFKAGSPAMSSYTYAYPKSRSPVHDETSEMYPHSPLPDMVVAPVPTVDLWMSTRGLSTAEATTANYQAGMEGVMNDARALAERIARLSLIHLNTYLGLYEGEGVWEGR